jgi:hypothetical protein
MEFKIELTNITKEEVSYILSGFYNYSSYWCENLDWNSDEYNRIAESIPKDERTIEDILAQILEEGGWLKITDEDDTRVLYKKDIQNGIQLSLDNGLISTDPESWDANDHDIIIQYALFGEVVYG